MVNLSLTACSFYIKKYNSRSAEKIYYLNDLIEIFDEEGEPKNQLRLVDLFKSFFNTYMQSISDENKNKTFNCTFKDEFCGETEDYFYLHVIIKSGNYGSSSEIKDIETQKVTYKKKANESEEKPFYLFIVIPKDSPNVRVQKGMFLFQNVGPYGVKTITTEYMHDYFSSNYNITLTCKTIAPKLFIDKVLKKENINKLIMTKNHKSGDSSDNIGHGYGVETRVLANLKFSEPLWQNIMKRIVYFAAGNFNLFEFEAKQYDGLKIYVKIGSRYRTINLNNIENLSIIEDIPDEIKGIDGHPKNDELIAHLMRVADDYLKEMVLSIC